MAKIFTKILESVFNTPANDKPVHAVRPFHEWTTVRPFHEGPTMRPFHEWTTMRPFHEWPILGVPLGPNWESKPPDIKIYLVQTEPPTTAVTARESGLAFSLEKLLWVFLSGFGVVVLMAIFMKLGGPIRRVRRQLSNVRPAPNAVITITLRPDVGNSDMASLLHSSDDLPPPYSECVRSSTSEHDIEEPPPRFSACFTSGTKPQDAEPQVHIRGLDSLIENGLRVDSIPMNYSTTVAQGMNTRNKFPKSLTIIDIIERTQS